MIEAIGLNSFNPTVTIKEIAKQISDRDNGVRSAALNVVTIAYQIVGDQVYKYTGKLNDKEMSYLEERIKRTGVKPQAKAEPAKQPAAAAAPMASSGSSSSISRKAQPDRERERERERQLPTEAPSAANGHRSNGHGHFEEEQQMMDRRPTNQRYLIAP